MDWTSFFKLMEKGSLGLLQEPLTYSVNTVEFRGILGPFLTDILARLVVYDGLLLDTSVQETFQNHLSTEAVRIIPVQFEERTYKDASKTTANALLALVRKGVLTQKELNTDQFFFGDLKSYTDAIEKRFHTLGGLLADSNRSIPRVLFYLELSRHLGLQVFLSYEKRNLLRDLGKAVWDDAFSIVSGEINRTVMQQQLTSESEMETKLQTPPLVDLIIRRAVAQKTSIEQSIVAIRNMEGAQQFRDKLAEIEKYAMQGDDASKLKIKKLVKRLLVAAQTWSEAADPDVTRMCQANVTKLPYVGAWLEALGIGPIEIPLKFRNRRSYVQFVSEWYRI